MMLNKFLKYGVSLSLGLPLLLGPAALVIAQQDLDRNLQTAPSSRDQTSVFNPAAFQAETSRANPIIASATLAAPSTSTTINLQITNLSNRSTIGARQIQAVIIDCQRAYNGRSLTIGFSKVRSFAGGKARVTTNNFGGGEGPAVIVFQGFNAGESATINLDPDTWEDRDFDTVRKDMVGCRVEVVFFPRGNLRGDGVMKLLGNGSVQAAIIQRQS